MDPIIFLLASTFGCIIAIMICWKLLNSGFNPKNLEQKIQGVPQKVLESITGSVSNQKGKLAELIAYLSLKSSYDRIIPLSNIVDFIVITFPTETDSGKLIFIDIKNGKSARLSDDQKALKKIIESGNVEFLKLNVTTDSVLGNADKSESDPTVQ
jgi:predicted Holliday junction resolvase-like endonuclease